MKIIAFSGSITNEVEEELEESTLMVRFVVLSKASIEDLQDSLKCVFKEDIGVVACNQFVGNDDELRVVLDVGGVNGLVVGRNRLLYLLQSVIQTVFKEISYLVLLLVENFL